MSEKSRKKSKLKQWETKRTKSKQTQKSLTFWLDWNTEHNLIKIAARLTDNRQFAEFGRIALKVIPALMRGDIEPLFECFPWIKNALLEMVEQLVSERISVELQTVPQPAIPNRASQSVLDSDLERILCRLREINIPTQDFGQLESRLSQKLDTLHQAILKGPTQPVMNVDIPDVDFGDTLLKVEADIDSKKTKSSGKNFLAKMKAMSG